MEIEIQLYTRNKVSVYETILLAIAFYPKANIPAVSLTAVSLQKQICHVYLVTNWSNSRGIRNPTSEAEHL